jgi:hypothetical protein
LTIREKDGTGIFCRVWQVIGTRERHEETEKHDWIGRFFYDYDIPAKKEET